MRIALPVLIAALSAAPLAAQDALTDAQVIEAMAAGATNKLNGLVSSCGATAGFGEGMAASMAGGVQPTGSYTVYLSSARGHLALKAKNAKRLYQPFGLADVTSEMREPRIYLTAVPDDPSRTAKVIHIASPLDAIVLKLKDSKPPVAIQPETFETTPVEWKNLLGATLAGTSAVATFSIGQFKELAAGDVDVVLITKAGERRCKIGDKDRAALLK